MREETIDLMTARFLMNAAKHLRHIALPIALPQVCPLRYLPLRCLACIDAHRTAHRIAIHCFACVNALRVPLTCLVLPMVHIHIHIHI